jgi:hypothetical protein
MSPEDLGMNVSEAEALVASALKVCRLAILQHSALLEIVEGDSEISARDLHKIGRTIRRIHNELGAARDCHLKPALEYFLPDNDAKVVTQ